MVKVNTIKLTQAGGRKSVRKAAKNRPQKLRSSLTAGTVVIPLTGQFRGKHVVMLKQMEKSGMILVSGPYGVNGVPMRRMNPRFVIATSTKLNLGSMDLKKYSDDYFKKSEEDGGKKSEEEFGAIKQKSVTSAARKADQKSVDAAILGAIGKDAMLKKYLKSKFSLSNGDVPHQMKF